MAAKRKHNLRGLASPIPDPDPLFIRLCSAFVDNLALLLRTALVIGAVMFVQDLRTSFQHAPSSVAEVPALPAAADDPAARSQTENPQDSESALSEGVLRALNCTYQEFRNAHYDECVDDPSLVYPRPQPSPDESGFLLRPPRVLHASVVYTAENASSL